MGSCMLKFFLEANSNQVAISRRIRPEVNPMLSLLLPPMETVRYPRAFSIHNTSAVEMSNAGNFTPSSDISSSECMT
ncbi:hypothetical protein [Thermoplasma acidophilum]|uniref:Uncharacterized protein n=1 Tax=Thermoplasma acidophilum (strain ATCC 25905 / DSM 1728 / JCM 9062 / NBRC 15155 / AMRC-C165) TaxID=273075 RepID=Q9HIM7_THEAC|nr:hypothetical protein [Thermoplasma acidophilum]